MKFWRYVDPTIAARIGKGRNGTLCFFEPFLKSIAALESQQHGRAHTFFDGAESTRRRAARGK